MESTKRVVGKIFIKGGRMMEKMKPCIPQSNLEELALENMDLHRYT